MCGICVVVSDSVAVDADLLRRMCDRIAHRGPDSDGYHLAPGVGLGMRRLSIIDVEGGTQPIYSEDRSLAIVFNGEIYNYRELREGLAGRGHRFTTASDTEAVLHLYEEQREGCLERLRGMFAFAVHERDGGRVFLARDRLGIKPLYWAEVDGSLYAASEIKSLLGLPHLPLTLDEVALDQYFTLLYVPAPRTIFREIHKLLPGHYLVKDRGRPAVVRRYWQLRAHPGRPRREEEWIDEFRERFDDAVKSHLVADVPLGVFLSGGVDSGGMVAAMARAGGTIRTFTLGFPPEYAHFDERRHARLVSERFGTDHEEIVVDPRVEETIQTVARVFDEPIGDSGAIPNFLVCQMARHRLTVALSGLGGDELGGGYQRYLGGALAEWYRRLPRVLRGDAARRMLDLIPESAQGRRLLDQAKRFVRHSALEPADRFLAFSSPLEAERRRRLYRPALLERVDFGSSAALMRRLFDEQPEADLVNRLMCIDLQSYMVDDLLAVADRVSMAVSLEVRVPFLDHPLVEFMATVPGNLKIRGLRKKYLLKKAFARDLPPALLNRRKSGFSLPVARWLREDLRVMLEDVVSPARLVRDGLFDPSTVETVKREHYGRERNWSGALWGLLMFHLWQDNYRSEAGRAADRASEVGVSGSVLYAQKAR